MNTHTPIAIREGRKVIAYTYRGIHITRAEKSFEFFFDRYDNRTTEMRANTLAAITAKIDEMLDKTGRTTGGKLVVTTGIDGRMVSALNNPDWRHPHARLVNP
jgi:hypothetical protein